MINIPDIAQYNILVPWQSSPLPNNSFTIFAKPRNYHIPPPVLLILGAGPKLGSLVAAPLGAKGYQIALAAGRFQDSVVDDEYPRLRIDLEQPEAVQKSFTKAK